MTDENKRLSEKVRYCGNKGPDGFLCILKHGHGGDHLSLDNREVWQDTPGKPVSWPDPPEMITSSYQIARALGFEGVECQECGSLSTTRNGSCLKCQNCGSTTGCS